MQGAESFLNEVTLLKLHKVFFAFREHNAIATFTTLSKEFLLLAGLIQFQLTTTFL
jgi:hypothetical protein